MKLYATTTFQGSPNVFCHYNKPTSYLHFIGDESETENLGNLIKFASLPGSGRFQTRQSNSRIYALIYYLFIYTVNSKIVTALQQSEYCIHFFLRKFL